MRYSSQAERLLANSFISTDTFFSGSPCWIWLGRYTNKGYGRINVRVDGAHRSFLAHRYALHVFSGVPLEEIDKTLHACDVKGCINPAHLTNGSQSKNMADWHESRRKVKEMRE